MTGSICVATHFLELFDSPVAESIGKGDSDSSCVLVITCALNFGVLSVDCQSFVGIPDDVTKANVGGILVDLFIAVEQFDRRSVKSWRVDGPQGWLANGKARVGDDSFTGLRVH